MFPYANEVNFSVLQLLRGSAPTAPRKLTRSFSIKLYTSYIEVSITTAHELFTDESGYFSIVTAEIPCNKSHLKLARINVSRLLTNLKVQDIQLLLETVKFYVLGITDSTLQSTARIMLFK